jgi:heterotetrameric sarcosine oxidase gamma subunit
MTALVKRTPLAAVYRSRGAALQEVDGWEVAAHYGDPDAERRALADGCVLVDWSHLGKIRIRGVDAANQAARLWPGAPELPPLESGGDENRVALRLADDEFLVLCASNRVAALLSQLDDASSAITDQSGALGALLLGGARRDAVVERSAAMDLSARGLGAGGVVQTTIHGIHCTVYRGAAWDLYLQRRDYTQSLFDALVDVGSGVGLVPAGLASVPVSLSSGADHA